MTPVTSLSPEGVAAALSAFRETFGANPKAASTVSAIEAAITAYLQSASGRPCPDCGAMYGHTVPCMHSADYLLSEIETLLFVDTASPPRGGDGAAVRQHAALEWAVSIFGEVARDRLERTMRFAEEATELAHALGLPRETLSKITERVYSRSVGHIPKEVGQAALTLEVLAQAIGLDASGECDREFARVKAIPKEEWDRRHAAKTAIGITADSPLPPAAEAGGWIVLDGHPQIDGWMQDVPYRVWLPDGHYVSGQRRAQPIPGAGEGRRDGGRALPFDRDHLGRLVREAWVRWALTQPSPKPSWLVPYDDLAEADKEADRQIGEAISRWTLIGDAANGALETPPAPAPGEPPTARTLAQRIGVLFVLAMQSDDPELRAAAAVDKSELDFRGDGPSFVPVAKLSSPPTATGEAEPVDMLLWCPACGEQHVDEPDERTPGWVNPPHRSHLCHACAHIWRPADVPTNGVRALKTQGKNDTKPIEPIKHSFVAEQQREIERLNTYWRGEIERADKQHAEAMATTRREVDLWTERATAAESQVKFIIDGLCNALVLEEPQTVDAITYYVAKWVARAESAEAALATVTAERDALAHGEKCALQLLAERTTSLDQARAVVEAARVFAARQFTDADIDNGIGLYVNVMEGSGDRRQAVRAILEYAAAPSSLVMEKARIGLECARKLLKQDDWCDGDPEMKPINDALAAIEVGT